jgi:alkylation response protein AidB-like acyl-CoA dehydrogenase
MAVITDTKVGRKGGAFLIEEIGFEDIFTPEDFSEEQKMIAQMTDEFMANEVLPLKDRMESGDHSATVEALRKAAELGLCGIEVPEKYTGMGLDKVSAMLVAEKMTRYGSFAVSYGGHTGIGTLPIVYFGNEEQKKKYLPRLVSGELLSAYALTEPWSGSDALAARAKAVLSADGKEYILNGTKRWISSAVLSSRKIFLVFLPVPKRRRWGSKALPRVN